jgi:RNA polymerase sigma-70 factor (ECF subfamily)
MTGFGASSYRRNPAADPQQLELLVHTYSDALVRYAYSIVRSSAVAEEIMEDTFAQLYVKGGYFPTEGHIRSWLYKVANSRAMDYLRRHKREVPMEDVQEVLPCSGPEEELILSERNQVLYLCLQKLPKQYRQVLQLRYFDEFTPEQIKAITGFPIKKVYNCLDRGRVTLKKLLIQEGISYEDI